MLTKLDVFEALSQRLPDLQKEDSDAAYDSVDTAALQDKAAAEIRVERWNGEPINGVDPRKHLRVLKDNPEALAFKVFVNNRLSRFEYEDYMSGGLITEDNIQALMDDTEAGQVEGLVDQYLISAVADELNK